MGRFSFEKQKFVLLQNPQVAREISKIWSQSNLKTRKIKHRVNSLSSYKNGREHAS